MRISNSVLRVRYIRLKLASENAYDIFNRMRNARDETDAAMTEIRAKIIHLEEEIGSKYSLNAVKAAFREVGLHMQQYGMPQSSPVLDSFVHVPSKPHHPPSTGLGLEPDLSRLEKYLAERRGQTIEPQVVNKEAGIKREFCRLKSHLKTVRLEKVEGTNSRWTKYHVI